MARRRRRKFSPEFKAEAVRLVESSEASIATIAQQLGLARGMLSRWVDQARPARGEPVGDAGDRTNTNQIATEYAQRGYVTFSIDYRLDPGEPVRRAPGRDHHEPARACPGDDAFAASPSSPPSTTPRPWCGGCAPTPPPTGSTPAASPWVASRPARSPRSTSATGPTIPATWATSTPTTPASRPRSPRRGARTCPRTSAPATHPRTCCTPSGIRTSTSAARRRRPIGARAGPVVDTMFFPHDPAHADLLYVLHKSDVDAAWTAFLVRQLGL